MANPTVVPGTPGLSSRRTSNIRESSFPPSSPYPVAEEVQNAPIGELPFLDATRQKELVSHMRSIDRSLTQLQAVHESLTNFNESIGSLLMGLDTNAWCVHFGRAPNSATWAQLAEMKRTQAKIKDLKAKIAQQKADRAVMPPPPAKRRRGATLNLSSARKRVVGSSGSGSMSSLGSLSSTETLRVRRTARTARTARTPGRSAMRQPMRTPMRATMRTPITTSVQQPMRSVRARRKRPFANNWEVKGRRPFR